jgi:hypothetical protein
MPLPVLIRVAGKVLFLHHNDTIISQAGHGAVQYSHRPALAGSKTGHAQKNHRHACGFFAAGGECRKENQVFVCTLPTSGT